MGEYIKEGFAEESLPLDRLEGRIHYVPNHKVVRPEKETTKYRLCFDGSARSTNELSLNDVVLAVSNPAPDLVRVLTRFRTLQIALCADVRKMFLMVKIRKEDRDFLSYIFTRMGD